MVRKRKTIKPKPKPKKANTNYVYAVGLCVVLKERKELKYLYAVVRKALAKLTIDELSISKPFTDSE